MDNHLSGCNKMEKSWCDYKDKLPLLSGRQKISFVVIYLGPFLFSIIEK